jgi:hypothetical protein
MMLMKQDVTSTSKPDRFPKPVRFSLTFLIYFLLLQSLSAQHISVESFTKLESDMDARVHHPKRDQNGELSAIIKVVTTETGFSFDGGTLGIVATEQKVAEIWVYIPRGAQRITIMHPKLGVLRNYAYPISIEAAAVYEMRLTTGRIETTVIPPELESQWLLITAEPNTALIYLDDVFEATGVLQKRLLPGTYTYRVENNLYHTEAGRISVTSEKRAELNVKLKPNFGFVEVKSTPETGARVQINGRDAGFTTNGKSEQLQSGDYTVTVIKEQFQPSSRQVTVKDNETTSLTLNMAPNFATVEVKLPSDATLFINNERRGTGNWSGRLNAGVYTLEARKDKHRPAKQDLQLQAGDSRTIELEPQPITGSLDVVTIPPMASIKLNGTDYGTTPNTIRNLIIGDYTLVLEKPGYGTVQKQVSITDGAITTIEETLASGKQLTIESTPGGASLSINGKPEGTTPSRLTLPFGNSNLRLTREGYVDYTGVISVTEAQDVYRFTLMADATAIAMKQQKKYNSRKNFFLITAGVSAATSAAFYFSADKQYEKYLTAVNNVSEVRQKVETYDLIWQSTAMVAAGSATLAIIYGVKNRQTKKKINLSAIPVDGGGVLSMRINF